MSIFDCIKKYALSDTENINSNLTAIGMFMNVADYTAKLTKERAADLRSSDISVRKTQINVTQIWQEMLLKM